VKPASIKPEVPIEALERLDIRVGTIRAVLDVPRSKKLMQLTVVFRDAEGVPVGRRPPARRMTSRSAISQLGLLGYPP
jgi:tRNA-binding EMAP/Myf-like protein